MSKLPLKRQWLPSSALRLGLIAGLLLGWVFSFPLGGFLPGRTGYSGPVAGIYFIAGFCLTMFFVTYKPVARWLFHLTTSKVAALAMSIFSALTYITPLPSAGYPVALMLLGISTAAFSVSLLSDMGAEERPAWTPAAILITRFIIILIVSKTGGPTEILPKLLAFLIPLTFLALPPGGRVGAAAPSDGRSSGWRPLIALAVFIIVIVPVEVLAWQRLFPVMVDLPGALSVSQLSYYLAVLLLAVLAERRGHPLLAAVALSTVGVGLTLFSILPGSLTASLAALLLLTVGVAGMDMYYYLTLWNLVPRFNASVLGLGLACYLSLFAISGSAWSISPAPPPLHPLASAVLISALFLSIPVVLRYSEGYRSHPAPIGSSSTGIDPDIINSMSQVDQRVFELLCRGYKDSEIADDLIVSPHTVKAYVRRILRKTGFKNRYELRAVLDKRKSNS